MKIVKKLVACVLATATAICCIPTLASANASNSSTVSVGDVNGDGVSPLDMYYISQFLNGSISVNAEQFTAMDANRDGIVDKTDYYYLNYAISHNINLGTTNNIYNVPYDDETDYLKHICGSGNANSSTQYTLHQATATPNTINDAPALLSVDNPDNGDTPCCVLLEIVDYNGNVTYGSGFIVDDNVIATAAHCLYENGFVKNVKVTLYAKEVYGGSTVDITYEANALSVHIPADYKTLNQPYRSNYDYGLITFDNFVFKSSSRPEFHGHGVDIDDYKAELGVMSDGFSTNTSKQITVTGFKSTLSGYVKYSSIGNMMSITSSNGYGYRFRSNAICPVGKSGGPAYFHSSAAIYSRNSVVGINTPNVYADAYGVRIDPSLLRFYLNNGYL